MKFSKGDILLHRSNFTGAIYTLRVKELWTDTADLGWAIILEVDTSCAHSKIHSIQRPGSHWTLKESEHYELVNTNTDAYEIF